jgi:outer membrane protein assembly factor BamD
MILERTIRFGVTLVLMAVLLSSCGLRRKKYDNRITKDTQQPDKVLFDAAIDDIEKSRYERARLTLQTLMNTYDTSEYMAKAKLALADSWFREGGAHGFAQAEAEYKDFILFYPTMEEAAEAQVKICTMQYNQIEKADRDAGHALRAEDECRQLLIQFPNSKFAPQAQQMLRNIQEVLADKEFKVGIHYLSKGVPVAAANRLQAVPDQYPLYSKADQALWDAATAYSRMGNGFVNQEANSYIRIVRDYPLSEHVEAAKAKLELMERPIPEADPVAYARMKYEIENRTDRSLMSKMWGPFSTRPSMAPAAKSGTPQMTGFRPTIPLSVPELARGGAAPTGEVIAVQPDANVIDKAPDARTNPGGGAAAAPAGQTGVPAGEAQPNPPGGEAAAPAAAASGTAVPDPQAGKKNNKAKKPPKPKKNQPAVKK